MKYDGSIVSWNTPQGESDLLEPTVSSKVKHSTYSKETFVSQQLRDRCESMFRMLCNFQKEKMFQK
jgi:hypothetical protein